MTTMTTMTTEANRARWVHDKRGLRGVVVGRVAAKSGENALGCAAKIVVMVGMVVMVVMN